MLYYIYTYIHTHTHIHIKILTGSCIDFVSMIQVLGMLPFKCLDFAAYVLLWCCLVQLIHYNITWHSFVYWYTHTYMYIYTNHLFYVRFNRHFNHVLNQNIILKQMNNLLYKINMN